MNCEKCDKELDGSFKSKRFCSNKCKCSRIFSEETKKRISEKLKKENFPIPGICENCNIEHDGTYATGRFCSRMCSASFSTKGKRKEINEKISKKLKGVPQTPKFKYDLINFICPICAKEELRRENIDYSTCRSKECISEFLSRKRMLDIENGKVGYGIKCEFKGIRCDSALEYAFLKWYLQKNPNDKIERYKGYIESEGIKYQPDFIINDKIIVEVKYPAPYIGDKLSKKWKTYVESQEFKKKILNSFEHLWITPEIIGFSFYRKCVDEIKSAQ